MSHIQCYTTVIAHLRITCRVLLERPQGMKRARAVDPPAELRRDFGTSGYYERCACGGRKAHLSEKDDDPTWLSTLSRERRDETRISTA